MEQGSDGFFEELTDDIEASCQAAERRPLSSIDQNSSPAQPDVAQPISIQVTSSLCARLIVWTGQR